MAEMDQARHLHMGTVALVGLQDKRASQIKEWEKNTRERVAKDAELKRLLVKYPFVLLAEPTIDGMEADATYSNFSFVHETTNLKKYSDRAQLFFYGGDEERTFGIDRGLKNFTVDLGKQDFDKNPDLEKISIDHSGLSADGGVASEGHVYLQHVNTHRGSDFYVLFQVVAAEKNGQFMAFVWRKLPGGKIVKQPEPK